MSSLSDMDAHASGAYGPVSLYVHVPFCLLKCSYCDFHSNTLSEADSSAGSGIAEHFSWSAGESVAHWASAGLLDGVVSVYVGGGTPTVLGEGLPKLIDRVRACAPWVDDAEVTVETNPDTTDVIAAGRLAESGVNRFSLGVQSFDDQVLATLGRSHDAASARRAAADLVASGARVSVDLICGVPGQERSSWQETLELAIDTGAGHVSVYPLMVEDSTPLAAEVKKGTLEEPDPDLAAEMMEVAQETLHKAGLERYEVASYARAGEECIHNCGYWTGRPFLGLGPSAVSMMPVDRFETMVSQEAWSDPSAAGVGRTIDAAPPDIVRVRFKRSDDTEAFMRNPVGPPEEVEYITAPEAAAEDAMLGLRLTRGISERLAEAAGASMPLAEMELRGLVEHSSGRWRISRAGWLLGNEVFGAVWHAGSRRGLA